jgi:hypothetical protein
MVEENEEMIDKVENRQESIQEKQEEFLEEMEDWFGEFDSVQLVQINKWQKEWYTESSEPIERRMEYRLKSQARLLALLRTFPDKLTFEKWMSEWTRSWGREMNSARDARILRNKERILQVDKFITREQRLHAIRELDDWVEILEETIANH